jgi:HEXXH motif-containing protein
MEIYSYIKPVKLTAYSNLFQGIVYTDWSENPLYYAESIFHEAAHSPFNYHFQQYQFEVDGTEYWSPWRRTNRPAFGILHGAWAFSYVYRFHHQLSKQIVTSSVTEQQIGAYKERSLFEAERLKAIRPTLQEVFKRLNNAKLRGLFEQLDQNNQFFQLN